MLAADVRRILAMILFVRPHVVVPSPHSVRRCSRVSLLPTSLQVSVGDILIRCSPTFVGMMSCITLNHVAVSNPDTGAVCRFFQIVTQSTCDYNFVILIPWCLLTVLISAFKVVFRRSIIFSVLSRLQIYATSATYSSKYPSTAGIRSR